MRYVGITLLFLLVYALVLRPVKKHAIAAFKQIPAHLASRSPPQRRRQCARQHRTSPGQRRSQTRRGVEKEIAEKIKAEPAAASRLVQTWIRDARLSDLRGLELQDCG